MNTTLKKIGNDAYEVNVNGSYLYILKDALDGFWYVTDNVAIQSFESFQAAVDEFMN